MPDWVLIVDIFSDICVVYMTFDMVILLVETVVPVHVNILLSYTIASPAGANRKLPTDPILVDMANVGPVYPVVPVWPVCPV